MADLTQRPAAELPTPAGPRSENIWIDQYFDERQSELTRLLQVIFKRWLLVAGVSLAGLALAAVWAYRAPRVYASSVNIQIDPQETVLPYKEVYAAVTPDPRYLGTQAQVLRSEALARQTVKTHGLAHTDEEAARVCLECQHPD